MSLSHASGVSQKDLPGDLSAQEMLNQDQGLAELPDASGAPNPNAQRARAGSEDSDPNGAQRADHESDNGDNVSVHSGDDASLGSDSEASGDSHSAESVPAAPAENQQLENVVEPADLEAQLPQPAPEANVEGGADDKKPGMCSCIFKVLGLAAAAAIIIAITWYCWPITPTQNEIIDRMISQEGVVLDEKISRQLKAHLLTHNCHAFVKELREKARRGVPKDTLKNYSNWICTALGDDVQKTAIDDVLEVDINPLDVLTMEGLRDFILAVRQADGSLWDKCGKAIRRLEADQCLELAQVIPIAVRNDGVGEPLSIAHQKKLARLIIENSPHPDDKSMQTEIKSGIGLDTELEKYIEEIIAAFTDEGGHPLPAQTAEALDTKLSEFEKSYVKMLHTAALTGGQSNDQKKLMREFVCREALTEHELEIYENGPVPYEHGGACSLVFGLS